MNPHKKPLIGVTADIELWEKGRPPRPGYFLDATNFDALREAGATAVMLPSEIDSVDDYLDLCDGILVSGGGYQFQVPQLFRGDGSEPPEKERRFRFEAALVRRSLERQRALLAVCGGFQVLNQVTGGELIVTLAEAREDWAVHRGEHYRQAVHTLQPVPGTRFAQIVGNAPFEVNSMHRQGVVKTGAGAVVAGLAPDGIVEAIEVPGQRFCLGAQWHPEFFNCEPERRLFAAFVEACRG